MKKTLFVLLMFSGTAFASEGNVNSGNGVTLGSSINHYSLLSSTGNPAMAALSVAEGEKWRFNYFPSFSTSLEIGDVDNFVDDIDELIDIIDDPSSTDDSATDVLDRFNDVLVRMGEEGDLKNSTSIRAPILPFYYKSDTAAGVFSVDFVANVQVGLRVLDSPLLLDTQTQSFISDTSIYLKSGIEKRISFGYGRQMFSDNARINALGDLYVGAKLNFISMEMSKQITRLDDLDGDGIENVIEDMYDNNLQKTNNVSVDFGVVWNADGYRAGLTVFNINSPDSSYGEVGVDCDQYEDASMERNSCEVSRYFVSKGRLKSKETYTHSAVARAEGMIKLSEKWLINSSLDLAAYDDFVGFENQWMNLSTSYEGGRWIPGLRVGYQQNMAGNELSSFALGFTFFKVLNIDVEWSGETVEVDDESVPRRMGFAFSFTERF